MEMRFIAGLAWSCLEWWQQEWSRRSGLRDRMTRICESRRVGRRRTVTR